MDEANGSNGEPAQVMSVRRVDRMVVDMTTYPTVLEVARRAGVTPQCVRQWQRKGKLTPLEDSEGTTRYLPEEVNAFLATRGELQDTLGEPEPGAPDPVANALYFRPREKLDDYQFKIIDRLMAQNERLSQYTERLEKRLEATFEAREARETARADEKLAHEVLTGELALKRQVTENMVHGVKKVVELVDSMKKKGGSPAGRPQIEFLEELPLETLELMFCMGDIYSDAARQKIARVVEQKKREQQATAPASSPAEASPATSSSPDNTAAPAAESK